MSIFTQNANIPYFKKKKKKIKFDFFSPQTFAPWTNASANHDGCTEQSRPITASTTMAAKLIICASEHQVLFDRRNTNKTERMGFLSENGRGKV